MYHKSVEEITKNLISTFYIFWMLFISKKRSNFTLCCFKIYKSKNIYYFIIT